MTRRSLKKIVHKAIRKADGKKITFAHGANNWEESIIHDECDLPNGVHMAMEHFMFTYAEDTGKHTHNSSGEIVIPLNKETEIIYHDIHEKLA